MVYITRDELEACRMARRKMDDLQTQIESLTSLAEKITVSYGHEGKGTPVIMDKMGERVTDIADKQTELWESLKGYWMLEEAVREALSALPPEEERVMRLRYIDNLAWEKIEEKAHYTHNGLMTLHRRALERLNQSAHTNTHKNVIL